MEGVEREEYKRERRLGGRKGKRWVVEKKVIYHVKLELVRRIFRPLLAPSVSGNGIADCTINKLKPLFGKFTWEGVTSLCLFHMFY